jgi:glycosyltransferase involved in cell wall biosynthesis
MATLTIIIATYRRNELLTRCLASITKYASGNVQLIVVDDSPDGEGSAVCLPLDVTYVRKSSHDRRGLARSRNIGLRFATGKFVAFIDDDDFLVNDHLVTMIENARESDFVFGSHFEFREGFFKVVDIGPVGLEELLIFNRLPPGSFAIRRDAIEYTFDEDLRSHEDWDFILKNLFGKRLTQFNLYPVAMDKTHNETTSHMGRTREYFWLDFLAIYARFPAPNLLTQRNQMLKNLGMTFQGDLPQINPYINQRIWY